MMEKKSPAKNIEYKNGKKLSAILLIIIIPFLLTLGGCNFLKRGDIHKTSESSPFIKSIGFRVADNALNPTLTEDIIHSVYNDASWVSIIIPYSVDTTAPLTLYWETVGDNPEIIIGEFTGADEQNPQPWEYVVLTDNEFTFSVAGTTQVLQLFAYAPPGLTTNEQIRVINVEVRKEFYPVLVPSTDYNEKIANPLVLRIGFADEDGNLIDNTYPADPATGSWDLANNNVYFDGSLINIVEPTGTNSPTYQLVQISAFNGIYDDLGPGWEIALEALTPDEQWMFFPSGIFKDEDGYSCTGNRRGDLNDPNSPWGSMVEFNYDPPPVYLSNRSGIPDDLSAEWGLVPEKPVSTWAEARILLDVNPGILDLFIEGSEAYYDTQDGGTDYSIINLGTRPAFNIYGGFRPGFEDRYPVLNNQAHGLTVLTDSIQDSLVSDGVLKYSGIGGTKAVLDRVVLLSTATVDDASALVIESNSYVHVNESVLVASSSDIIDSSAVKLDGNTTQIPEISKSLIIGKTGGAETSRGIYLDTSGLLLSETTIFSGEASTNGSIGIEAVDSSLDVKWTTILSGVGHDFDNIVDNIIDEESIGISLNTSSLNIHDALVQSGDTTPATGSSIAVKMISSGASYLNSVTLVSGGGLFSIGLDCSGSPLNLYNSVLMSNTGSNSAIVSYGIRLAGMAGSQIYNNAIYARKGSSSTVTAGILFGSLSSFVEIKNNLIWTRNLANFEGIATTGVDISGNTIQNNNIWSLNENAGMDVGADLGSGVGYYDLKDVQNASASITGNVSLELSVNTNLDTTDYFEISHQQIGKVRTPVPDDIRFGGIDFSLIPSFPEGDGSKRDRRWNPKTGYMGLEWSIGPYEFDDTGSPSIIYVSDRAHADDNHPLGTMETPFATLARGYDLARGAQGVVDDRPVVEIRVEAGDYDVGTTPLPLFQDDIAITGGWNNSFSGQTGTSKLFRGDVGGPVVRIDGNAITGGFILDGFTLESQGTNASALMISGGAFPTITDNQFGADTTVTGAWTGVTFTGGSGGYFHGNHIDGPSLSSSVVGMLVDGSSPNIHDNNIDGGTGNPGKNTMLSLSAGSNPEIQYNTITGGNPDSADTVAIEISNASSPWIHNNTIRAGSPTTSGSTTAILDDSTTGSSIHNNTIDGGDTPSGDTITIHATGTGSSSIYDNSRITAGDGNNSKVIWAEAGNLSIHDNPDIRLGNSLSTDVYGIQISSINADISNCTISGGIAVKDIIGIFFDTVPSGSSNFNTVTPGSGENSYGIYVSGANVTINQDTVEGGTGFFNSTGIYFNDATSSYITDTSVHGGISQYSTGLHILMSWDSIISENQVFGGISTGDSLGMYVDSPSRLVIRNNFIHGGRAGGSDIRGLKIDSAVPNSRVYNNTIFGGNSPGVNSVAIHAQDGNAHYINNIIIAGNGATPVDSLAFWQETSGTPSRFINNLILGLNASAEPYTLITIPQDETDINSIPGHSGNMVSMGESITAYLRSFSASGTAGGFPGGDWHLTGGGSRDATAGGLNLSNDDGDSYYNFDKDIDYQTRPVDPDPWSVGADEL